MVLVEGIYVDPAKTEAVNNLKVPQSVLELRSFLSSAGYYRRFLKGFTKIPTPLSSLIHKGKKYKYT